MDRAPTFTSIYWIWYRRRQVKLFKHFRRRQKVILKEASFVISKVSTQMAFGARTHIKAHFARAARCAMLWLTVNMVTTAHNRANVVDCAGAVVAKEHATTVEHLQLLVSAIGDIIALHLELALT